MIAGPLFVIGLALFFSGAYRACTGVRLFEIREDAALACLGAAMMGGAWALWARGMA